MGGLSGESFNQHKEEAPADKIEVRPVLPFSLSEEDNIY